MLFLTLKRANGLKTSYGEIIDKLLVFFDQEYHFLEILDTKTQKRYKNLLKKILLLFLTLNRANWLKTSYGEIIDKLLVFFYQKYHFLEILDTNKKTRLKFIKKILVLFLTLKRANGLKTSYGEIFDKLFVFFDQKYHFLEILDTKTQKRD